jgi:hypothetical protein
MRIEPIHQSRAAKRRTIEGSVAGKCRRQFGFRSDLTMTTALRGRPGRGIGQLKEKTVHATLTKQRIHAIVGQVIDELEHRRATGKADYVKRLADEVEKGGIAAWKSLRDLLPRDEDTPSSETSFNGLFVLAAKQAAQLPGDAPILLEEAQPLQLEGARKAGPLVIDAAAEDVTEEKVEW